MHVTIDIDYIPIYVLLNRCPCNNAYCFLCEVVMILLYIYIYIYICMCVCVCVCVISTIEYFTNIRGCQLIFSTGVKKWDSVTQDLIRNCGTVEVLRGMMFGS